MEDLKILVDGILGTAPNYSYMMTTHSCPFCLQEEYGNDLNDITIEDIKHKEDCLYLKALEIENNKELYHVE